jgi:hypothetical protein
MSSYQVDTNPHHPLIAGRKISMGYTEPFIEPK